MPHSSWSWGPRLMKSNDMFKFFKNKLFLVVTPIVLSACGGGEPGAIEESGVNGEREGQSPVTIATPVSTLTPIALPEPSADPEPSATPDPAGSPEPIASSEPIFSPEPIFSQEPIATITPVEIEIAPTSLPTATPLPGEPPKLTTTPLPTSTPTATASSTPIPKSEANVEISILDAESVMEGDEGITSIAFTVNSNRILEDQEILVSYQITGGMDDGLTSNVAISAGASTATIYVTTQGDTVREADEQVSVTLTETTVGSVSEEHATGTSAFINDDQRGLFVGINDPEAIPEGNEGTASLVFTISLSRSDSVPVAITYRISGGIEDGQERDVVVPVGSESVSINVTTLGDQNIEDDEPVSVTLLSTSHGVIRRPQRVGHSSFLNDDALTPIVRALSSGDYLLADPNPAAGDEGASVRAMENIASHLASIVTPGTNPQPQLLNALFDGVGPINWVPTAPRSLSPLLFELQQPVLSIEHTESRSVDVHQSFAVASELGGRYLAVGANPMRTLGEAGENRHESLGGWVNNAIRWLVGFEPSSQQVLRTVVANVSPRHRRYTYDWLENNYGENIQLNDIGACDNNALGSCITDETHLVVVSTYSTNQTNVDEIIRIVQKARRNGAALLFVYEGNSALATAFEEALFLSATSVPTRASNNPRLENWVRDDLVQIDFEAVAFMRDLITRYPNNLPDLSSCELENNDEGRPLISGCIAQTRAEWVEPMATIRRSLNELSRLNARLFDEHADQFWQLSLLWADAVRSQVVYGEQMIQRTDISKKLRRYSYNQQAYFAAIISDSMVYLNRNFQRGAPDMGNYSRPREQFSITPGSITNHTVTLVKGFTSTGIYLLPGETVTIQRTDNSDANIELFVSTVRSGSTNQYTSYNRPKYLRSVSQKLKNGQALTLSSPFGGPMYIDNLSREQAMGEEVVLSFSNVAKHPTLKFDSQMSPRTMRTRGNQFVQAVERNEFDWADIVFPSLEVHSRADLMEKTLIAMHRDGEYLYRATKNYFLDNIYSIAGLRLPNMADDKGVEVFEFIESKGWPLPLVTETRHSNHDQASCGSACSGNPMDMGGAFVPPLQGSGIIHEYGHKLIEDNFIVFQEMNGHGQVNSYGEYMRGWLRRHYEETLGQPLPWYVNPLTDDEIEKGLTEGNRASFQCNARPWEFLYNQVLESKRTGIPARYRTARELEREARGFNPPVGSETNTILFWQMLVIAQANGIVENPYAVQGRLQGYGRALAEALTDESTWNTSRESLGLTQYSFTEAKQMSDVPGGAGNRSERLAIALSVVTGHNYMPWLERFSIDATFREGQKSKVVAQLNALNLEELTLPEGIYIPEYQDGYCNLNLPRDIPLEGEPVVSQPTNSGRTLFESAYYSHRDSDAAGFTAGRTGKNDSDDFDGH